MRWADESLLDLQSDGAIAATSGSFIGAGGFAARMLASVIGMLVLCTVAAAHVGGEFGGGTIRGVFLQDPRRWRVMLAKAISLLIFAVFLWAVLWASTVVVGMVAHRVLSLPAALPAADQWEYMVSGFARGMLPMATFIALGMMFGAITRSALAGAAAAIGVLFMGLITSALGIRAWSIGAWIADLMQFQQRIVFVDFVWTKAGYPSLTTGFAASGLLLTVLIGIATTLWRVQRIDID